MDFMGYISRQKAIIRRQAERAEEERDIAVQAAESVRRQAEQLVDFTESDRLLTELDNLDGLNTRERLVFCA